MEQRFLGTAISRILNAEWLLCLRKEDSQNLMRESSERGEFWGWSIVRSRYKAC